MRKPKSKALYVSAVVLAMFAGTAATAKAAYKTVSVQDNGQRKVLHGFSFGNLGTFLQQQHVKLAATDRVAPVLTSPVRDGMTVTVEPLREIELVDGGKVTGLSTYASTVGEFLHEQGVVLGSQDTVSLPLTTALQTGQVVRITRRETKVSTKTQEIPFQTIRQWTGKLYVGEQRVLTHGVKGLQEIETSSVYVDGHKVGETVKKKIVHKPVSQVVLVGDTPRPYVLSARGEGSMVVLRQLTVVATAYRSGGYTMTGWAARPGVVAVDPSVIPLGSKIYIPGIGIVRAEDTGGAIVGDRIDICMSTTEQADAWGVRTITIYIIK